MNMNEIKALVAAEKDWIVSMRRALHRIPERGFAEFKTQKAVTDALDEMAFPTPPSARGSSA